MPVERWPKAARERSAWLRARGPPLLRFSKVPSRKAPSLSRVDTRNMIGDVRQAWVSFSETISFSATEGGREPQTISQSKPSQKLHCVLAKNVPVTK
jgi:hypothetical protein